VSSPQLARNELFAGPYSVNSRITCKWSDLGAITVNSAFTFERIHFGCALGDLKYETA
jgi:hypothetical protein